MGGDEGKASGSTGRAGRTTTWATMPRMGPMSSWSGRLAAARCCRVSRSRTAASALVAAALGLWALDAGAQAPAAARADIAWVRVPAGTFQMGCVADDERCNVDERPRHAVTVSRPFDLMATEVTIGMYRRVVKAVDEQPAWSTRDDYPVVIVTWQEAAAFCTAIGGRLPTEAEWEYAARGGRDAGIYPWGSERPAHDAGAPTGAAFEGDAARPVTSFAANAFGLFDMAGNVWEWTADAGSLYRPDAVTDPQGPMSGQVRILRGGSFGDDASNLRISNRTPNQPDRVHVNVGFRCARDARPS